MAVYTRCLRCAGAPRRPASGSELSLRVLSWHAVPWDPGEFEHRQFQNSGVDMAFAANRPARHSQNPAIRFAREVNFVATWFAQSLRPARLLAPLYGSDRLSARPSGAFTSRLSAGRSPFPLLDMTTTVTGLLCWRDFHPQERQLASLQLFDDLGGAQQLRRRHLDAERPSRS
jgi:hypothetical protein